MPTNFSAAKKGSSEGPHPCLGMGRLLSRVVKCLYLQSLFIPHLLCLAQEGSELHELSRVAQGHEEVMQSFILFTLFLWK